jgi:hypothetical protein
LLVESKRAVGKTRLVTENSPDFDKDLVDDNLPVELKRPEAAIVLLDENFTDEDNLLEIVKL